MGSTHSLRILLLLIVRSIIVSLVLAMSGCATLDSVPLAPDAGWFDVQLAASEYAQAATALQQWRVQRSDDPQLAGLAEKLDTATAQFRSTAITDAQQLRAQQRWADADQRLLVALQQLPDDVELKAEYSQFDTQREQQRQSAQHEFDVAYAQSLPALLQHARAVFELKPQDLNAAAQLKGLQDSANSITARLAQAARRAQQQGDMTAAAQDMRLAAQLSGDAALEQQARQLEQALEKTAQKPQQKSQRAPASVLIDALATLDAALDGNQLDAAQSQLKTLHAKYAGNTQLEQRTQRFESLRHKFVSNAIEQGRRYYSTGDLTKAIEIWEAAYLLDPANADLRDRIDRAQRFRAKVESLQ